MPAGACKNARFALSTKTPFAAARTAYMRVAMIAARPEWQDINCANRAI